ncbi:MAG: GTP-binding protein [Succinivibrionaceae bacterium]|nr:GTP-binding protein [Ruminobacter sp.]MDY5778648.1 GTP-binding protein [Succinivibrionaceae bacterium]MEE1340462.1 GTP-binding protein [Succinivibrionaceae bacterium]
MEEREQILLQILTGFLGSGKTTLLNKVIQDPKMKGTVLIINEVGEIGIDDKLISTDNPVVLLDSGCICCSLQDGLIQTLHFLLDQKESGELNFNRVIIETTGIADPAPILNMIFDFLDLDIAYKFAGTVTVVDGVNATEELKNNYESVKQIALADKVIISKCDLINENDIAVLKDTILALNPTTTIYESSVDNSPIDAFLDFKIFETPKDLNTILSWINNKRKDLNLASGMKLVKSSSISKKGVLATHSNYDTIAISFDKPLNRISVIQAFNAVNEQYGSSVLRMKGIFDFGEGYPFVIHGVCGECYPISNLAEWEGNKPFSEMVVICSPNIAPTIEHMFKTMIKPIDESFK